MNMMKSGTFQVSPLTGIQKAFYSPGDPDGGTPYDSILVVDDTIRKGQDGREFYVYCNRGELRAALLDAEQRGDHRILPSDASLIDSGRIRKAVAEILYPDHDWRGVDDSTDGRPGWRGRGPLGPDGQSMVKGRAADVVARADRAYESDLKKAARDLDALVERQRRG